MQSAYDAGFIYANAERSSGGFQAENTVLGFQNSIARPSCPAYRKGTIIFKVHDTARTIKKEEAKVLSVQQKSFFFIYEIHFIFLTNYYE